MRYPVRLHFLSSSTLLIVAALVLAGCPKRPVVVEAPPAPVGPPPAAVPAPPALAAPQPTPAVPPEVRVPPRAETPPPPVQEAPATAPQRAPEAPELKDVFFDFDRSQLRHDQQAALRANVAWLKAHPQAQILVEGHCDERGTAEYNLTLGERRAQAVRHYLIRSGIPPVRIATVSYGEEHPFVVGHDESAWKYNRRAHFVLLTK